MGERSAEDLDRFLRPLYDPGPSHLTFEEFRYYMFERPNRDWGCLLLKDPTGTKTLNRTHRDAARASAAAATAITRCP